MTNTKSTKRALLASVLSLLLCFSMLVGSTFAWFTDSASTGVNTIQSGTIDIRLEDIWTGESLEGKSLGWLVDGKVSENVLWEPGVTFVSYPVRVMNYSNLTFEMDMFVSGFQGDLELLESLEFMVVNAYYALPESMGGLGYTWDECDGRAERVTGPGTTIGADQLGKDTEVLPASDYGIQADWSSAEWAHQDWNFDGVVGEDEYGPKAGEAKPIYDVCIMARMKEEAGNEYQGLTLTGAALTVVAKQYRYYEHDSYDGEYDANAEWPKFGKTVTEGNISVPAG